jgi:hypothetical protein
MRFLFFIFFCTLKCALLTAQSGCPGCTVSLPAGLSADTVYLPPLPSGQQGVYYDQDISFRLPKTTTPVAAIDSVTPPGLTITSLEILAVEGLPPGLSWEASQTFFEVATQTDGCIKICGTPLASDSFEINVVLKATVFIIVQETSFSETLYIAPPSSTTVGFSMTNNIGCGSTTVSFTNNIPSNGAPGFEYSWDYGDSTDIFPGENPPPHTYSDPGTYVVRYQATVDTSGFTLTTVRVLAADCVDQLGFGTPDLFVRIKDPNGVQVFESPVINNANTPVNIPINLLIGDGNYTFELWDDDSGLKGGDDACGTVPFNQLSNDTLTSGVFSAVFQIVNPISTVTSTDTVYVYVQPDPPVISAPAGLFACADDVPIVLESSYSTGNQWFNAGQVINGAVDSVLEVNQSGFYVVTYTSPDGCVAGSEPALVNIRPLPAVPAFVNINNRLRLLDTLALPVNYQLQWYQDGVAIPDADGFTYCTTESGVYTLEVLDWATGCTNSFTLGTVLNPAFDCTVGAQELLTLKNWTVYPNPAQSQIEVLLPAGLPFDTRLDLLDMTGRVLRTESCSNERMVLNISELPMGVFTFRLLLPDGAWAMKRWVKG